MTKAVYAAVLVCFLSGVALAESLQDAPLPDAISLVRDGDAWKFTDDNGQSLYTFDRDTDGHSTCDGSCAASWPAVTASNDAHPIGDWTPVRRADNGLQWAYKNKPVYTYRGDAQPGQAKGDGVGGVWHLLKP